MPDQTSAGFRVRPSYRYSAGIVALRPNQDGRITGYTGVAELHARYGENTTKGILSDIGETLKVWAG